MRFAPALLLPALLCALPALAEDPPAVDLSLPSQPMFSGAGAFGDGEYTGPRHVAPASRAVARDGALVRGGCPTSPDGSEATVTGSVSTGIGYSSRGGNSNWNAAEINLCREGVGDSGNVNTANLNIRVGRYDGPGYPLGHYFDGPAMYGHPYDAGFGPMDGFGPGFHGAPRRESWTDGRRPWR
ncbi:hypothetical protein LDO26_02830 [Luteimonas sp. BDR2-5]|uniref:hypothetical protein n=1 Tax=Proluteimonas luteida TaxID=2878685 RepID=UPI001E5300A2|nr:hypothetical protein [Luteimonas sp. BDR2-5]MCD9027149.1 hypothetical protein [Luteimonas sp. BDR2-5]